MESSSSLPVRPASVRLLAFCLGFLSISALFGGFVFVSDPTGGILGMPVSVLEFSPFQDFLIPGLILGIVFGLGSLLTLWGLWSRPTSRIAMTRFTGEHWSWSAALAIGFGQIIWIVTEVLMIRGVNVLHFIFGGLGVAIVLLTLEPHVRHWLDIESVAS